MTIRRYARARAHTARRQYLAVRVRASLRSHALMVARVIFARVTRAAAAAALTARARTQSLARLMQQHAPRRLRDAMPLIMPACLPCRRAMMFSPCPRDDI